MSSGDLTPGIPGNHDQLDPDEVQFALVIARMIETVQNSPEHMRQAVYDLARYKLQEQFTDADANVIGPTQQALETAIRGVEKFSRQQFSIPGPPPVPQLSDHTAASHDFPPPTASSSARSRRRLETNPEAVGVSKPGHPLWPIIKRTAAISVVVAAVFVAFQQRERLALLVEKLPKYDRPAAPPPQPSVQAIAGTAAKPPPAKPDPLRPTDYGVYAISNDQLAELQLLPGRPPDIRVAVSAALKVPSRTVLPNGHPKFIVFRRDVAANFSDRAEVRVVAKIAREFSAEAAAGKRPEDGDAWVIRNVSFPFRASPLPDNPEMYELHSEDPALELTPGRYALVLKAQAYDFTVEGNPVDPKQCIERIVATNGTFYTDCRKP
jgi:hypothetical protein